MGESYPRPERIKTCNQLTENLVNIFAQLLLPQFQSLLTRMLDIILKEFKGEEEQELVASPRALVASPRALALTQKKSADNEGTATANSQNGGRSTVDCKIWPWDMGMGFGPNSGLRVRC